MKQGQRFRSRTCGGKATIRRWTSEETFRGSVLECRKRTNGTASLSSFLLSILLFAFAASSAPQSDAGAVTNLAPGLVARTVGSGLWGVVNSCNIDENRAFVVSKLGLIHLWNNGDMRMILDMRRVRPINANLESGLVDCAVSGDLVYFFYSTKPAQIVSTWNFNLTWGVIDTNSEKILLSIPTQTSVAMHTGSGLLFSTDRRYLFVTSGDNAACEFRGYFNECALVQSVDSFVGKVLRLDARTGRGVRGNPFWNGNPRSVRSRIWALGFRNPWSSVLVPGSNDLLVFDVGRATLESIKRIRAGTQGGWPCFEGSLDRTLPVPGGDWFRTGAQVNCTGAAGTRSSVVVYDMNHNGTGSAIIGGAWLPREHYRAEYAGRLIFADYVRGGIFAATANFGRINRIGLAEGTVKIKLGPSGRLWLINMADMRIQEVYDSRFLPADLNSGTLPGRCPIPAGGPLVSSIVDTVYEETMPASAIELGWRCNLNMGVRRKCARDGRMQGTRGEARPMSLAGRRFSYGFGVRGKSSITIPLAGRCGSFSSGFGLDDTSLMTSKPRVEFMVVVDGEVLARRISNRNAVQYIRNISLVGAQSLILTTRQTHGGFHNAIWADPILLCGPDSPYMPRAWMTAIGFDGLSAVPGQTISFTGTGVDRLGARIAGTEMNWQLIIKHCQGSACHAHPMQIVVTGSASASFLLPDHDDCVWYDVELEVKDSCGRIGKVTRSILIKAKEAVCAGSGVDAVKRARETAEVADAGDWSKLDAPIFW